MVDYDLIWYDWSQLETPRSGVGGAGMSKTEQSPEDLEAIRLETLENMKGPATGGKRSIRRGSCPCVDHGDNQPPLRCCGREQ